MIHGTPLPPESRIAADAIEQARGRRYALALVLCWAAVLWFLVPHGIGTSWRECETQAIARNFVLDGFDPLRPRVDWRGLTDGAVECEFPLYQLAVGSVLALVGFVEWPGRLLSLLSMVVGALAAHRLLERRAAPSGALAGLGVLLCCGSALILGARVIPDGTSFAFGMVGLCLFDRWLRTSARSALLAAALAVLVSSLQKPLSLQLGIVMFGWTLAWAPRKATHPLLWGSFALILLPVCQWLRHGADLHAETGLSFGVVSGGDSKFPDAAHLLDLRTHATMAWSLLVFGCSAFGMVGFVVALVRRRLGLADWTLLGATALGLLVSFRYSHNFGLGPHYHIFAAFAGAWCVAIAWPRRASRWTWLALGLALAVQGAWRLKDERGVRIVVNQHPIMAAAKVVQDLSKPDDLVVVRSDKPRLDKEWHSGNNFEDPRLLYQSRRRGFALPMEEFDPDQLARLRWLGARFVFDPTPAATSAATNEWLQTHAELVHDTSVRVWRFLPLR
ncbi:MAG: hypothetical protein JNK15_04060 [Planctomycetes bacterium]|nr:hypothetical protein [Planctomycetota bacterium]